MAEQEVLEVADIDAAVPSRRHKAQHRPPVDDTLQPRSMRGLEVVGFDGVDTQALRMPAASDAPRELTGHTLEKLECTLWSVACLGVYKEHG